MRIAVLVLAVGLLAGCGMGGKTTTVTRTVTKTVTATTPGSTAPGQQNATYFGTVTSITKADAKRYLLVLKPQFFLVGVTANVVGAVQQGVTCAPLSCPGVEDDRLVVPAGSQQLTFVLPVTTGGTVLTLKGTNTQETDVSATQLAALVGGATTPKLVEPLASGVWLAVNVDTVTSFAQQFQP